MRTAIRFVCVLLCLSIPAFARIRDTLEQCIKRYGEPIDVKSVKSRLGSPDFNLDIFPPKTVFFQKEDVLVAVSFHKEKADLIAYTKIAKYPDSAPFSDEEVKVFLKANGGGLDWVAIKPQSEFSEPVGWRTNGGTLVAMVEHDDLSGWSFLVITTEAYRSRPRTDEKADASKSSAADKLKGF